MRAILAILAAAALLSGCASNDTDATSTETGASTLTGATNGTAPAPKDFSCSTVAGATGSFTANIGGNEVGGCTFTTAAKESTITAATIPSGCGLYQTPPDSGQVSTSSAPAEVGQTYPGGTAYLMFCDATAIQPTGTVTLQATAESA